MVSKRFPQVARAFPRSTGFCNRCAVRHVSECLDGCGGTWSIFHASLRDRFRTFRFNRLAELDGSSGDLGIPWLVAFCPIHGVSGLRRDRSPWAESDGRFESPVIAATGILGSGCRGGNPLVDPHTDHAMLACPFASASFPALE